MKNRQWFRAWLVVGAIVSVGLLLWMRATHAVGDTVAPPVRSANTASRSAEPEYTTSGAYRWLDIALEATAREHERNSPRPTVGSRMLGIVVTSVYDA